MHNKLACRSKLQVLYCKILKCSALTGFEPVEERTTAAPSAGSSCLQAFWKLLSVARLPHLDKGPPVVSDPYADDGGHGGPVLEIAGTAVERLETSFPLSTRRGSGSPADAVRQSATGTLTIPSEESRPILKMLV